MIKQARRMPRKATRPVTCQHKCRKPTPTTLFIKHHPFKDGWEIRRCPNCGKDSAFDSRAR